VFYDFAEERGFDPLDPTNWHKVTTTQFVAAKVVCLDSCSLNKNNDMINNKREKLYCEEEL